MQQKVLDIRRHFGSIKHNFPPVYQNPFRQLNNNGDSLIILIIKLNSQKVRKCHNEKWEITQSMYNR